MFLDEPGKFCPPTANANHNSLRAQYTTEAQLRILISDPVFTTLIFPGLLDHFHADTDRKLVDNIANSDI